MAAIIVYKKNVNDAGRQQGMADFGGYLRVALDNYATQYGKIDVANAQRLFLEAFQNFIVNADYTIRFESPVVGEEQLLVIRAHINSSNRLKLILSKDGTTKLRKVRLIISIDDLDNAERRMHIAIPHKSGGNAFGYLNGVVVDVDTLAPKLDRATDYLISTNFFTRCA